MEVTVRVLTYNVLADCYTRPEYFPYCSKQNIEFKNRAIKVIAELKSTMADIICLQELDHFTDFYASELTKLGYSIFYNQKGQGRKDGLIIGFLPSKFKYLSKAVLVEYDKIEPKIQGYEFYQGYIGHILPLEIIGNSNTVLLIGNTHLWAMGPQDTRFGQISVLIDKMSQMSEKIMKETNKKVAAIITGDMNTLPGDPAFYRFYNIPLDLSKEKSAESQNIMHFQAKYRHSFSLKSAYETYKKVDEDSKLTEIEKMIKGHPEYTNFTNNFKGCLDYILYDYRLLKIRKLLPIPDKEICLKETALPNTQFPSDHIRLEAEFLIKQ